MPRDPSPEVYRGVREASQTLFSLKEKKGGKGLSSGSGVRARTGLERPHPEASRFAAAPQYEPGTVPLSYHSRESYQTERDANLVTREIYSDF